jgi:hypothetical protein
MTLMHYNKSIWDKQYDYRLELFLNIKNQIDAIRKGDIIPVDEILTKLMEQSK